MRPWFRSVAPAAESCALESGPARAERPGARRAPAASPRDRSAARGLRAGGHAPAGRATGAPRRHPEPRRESRLRAPLASGARSRAGQSQSDRRLGADLPVALAPAPRATRRALAVLEPLSVLGRAVLGQRPERAALSPAPAVRRGAAPA